MDIVTWQYTEILMVLPKVMNNLNKNILEK